MKKPIALIASASLVVSAATGVVVADKETRNPSVYIDNRAVEFPDQKAYITDEGRTLVPARGVFEALDCSVSWDAEEYKVTINNENLKKEIVLTIDDTLMSVATDGKKENKTLEVPAQIMNDRTMIPLRAVSEALGCEVNWDGTGYRIDITGAKKEYAPLTNTISLKAPTGTIRVGDEITVPVMLSNAKGLKGVMFKITWNPKQLQMLGTNISTSKTFEGFTDFPKLFNSFIDVNQTEIANGKLSVVCSADKIVDTDNANYLLGNLHFKVLEDAGEANVAISFDTSELKTSGNNGEANLAFAGADAISIAVKEKIASNTGSGSRPSSGSGSNKPSSGSNKPSSGSGSSSSGSDSSGSGSEGTDEPDNPTTPDEPDEPDGPEVPDEPVEQEALASFSFASVDAAPGETIEVEISFESQIDVNIIALASIALSNSSAKIVGFEFSDEAKAIINSGLSTFDTDTNSVIALFNDHMSFSGVLGTLKIKIPEGFSGDITISADDINTNCVNEDEGLSKIKTDVVFGEITVG